MEKRKRWHKPKKQRAPVELARAVMVDIGLAVNVVLEGGRQSTRDGRRKRVLRQMFDAGDNMSDEKTR